MSHAIRQARLPRRLRLPRGVVRRGGRLIRRGVRLLRPGERRRRRRGRGISATELRGFKKVARLLADFGMAPRGLRRGMIRPRRLFGRR